MAKKKATEAAPKADANVSKDEQIGFHKGSLSTLAKEREEMMRILQIVEQLMQMHIKGLKEFRAMYKTWLKSGVDKRFIQSMEKLYDDMVIGGMYSSRSAEERGILKIDGRTKYKNANW